jgi:hypothetical protein
MKPTVLRRRAQIPANPIIELTRQTGDAFSLVELTLGPKKANGRYGGTESLRKYRRRRLEANQRFGAAPKTALSAHHDPHYG